MRASSIGRSFLLASVAPLVGACFDDHTAEECMLLGSCPYPDAGAIVVQQSPPPCEGQCVPPAYADWFGPYLVQVGPKPQPGHPLLCPDQTSDIYDGVAAPAALVCGACTCQPSTGSCALPATVTAHSDQCPGTGSGTAFDPPSVWDGSCTTPAAIAGGVESVTVAPLMVNQSCVAVASVASEPSQPQIARACKGAASGTCKANGVCLPDAESWMYCISHDGAGDPYTAHCPTGSPYQELHVFADGFEPACSPCNCGQPEGSACAPSLISFYADSACSEQIASVSVQSSASMCVDILAASSLGSMTASPTAYTPGTCMASGGTSAGPAIPDAPVTYCCLPQQRPAQ